MVRRIQVRGTREKSVHGGSDTGHGLLRIALSEVVFRKVSGVVEAVTLDETRNTGSMYGLKRSWSLGSIHSIETM